jgi:hypothetical protein
MKVELTRFDMQNQVIQRRIAEALARIADLLEKLWARNTDDLLVRAYTLGFNTARGIEGDADPRVIKKTFDRELDKFLKKNNVRP